MDMQEMVKKFIIKYKKRFNIDLSVGDPTRNLFLEFSQRPQNCRAMFNTSTVGASINAMKFIAWVYKHGKRSQ